MEPIADELAMHGDVDALRDAISDNEQEGEVTERRLAEIRRAKTELEDAIEMIELTRMPEFQKYMTTLRRLWVSRIFKATNPRNSQKIRDEFTWRADEVRIIIAAIERKPMQIKNIQEFIEQEQEKAKPSMEEL